MAKSAVALVPSRAVTVSVTEMSVSPCSALLLSCSSASTCAPRKQAPPGAHPEAHRTHQALVQTLQVTTSGLRCLAGHLGA